MSGLDAAALKHLLPQEYYSNWLQTYPATRPDGRKMEETRAVSIEYDVISSADGSAIVRLGGTTCVASVKAQVVEEAEGEEQGQASHFGKSFEYSVWSIRAVPNVTFAAGSAPHIRSGPPSEQHQALVEGIRQLFLIHAILPLDGLVAISGMLRWVLFADVIVLNDSGNAFDCILLAITAALVHARLPTLHLDEAAGIVSVRERRSGECLPLAAWPVSLSWLRDDEDALLLHDPDHEEELSLLKATLCRVILDLKTDRILQETNNPPPHRPHNLSLFKRLLEQS